MGHANNLGDLGGLSRVRRHCCGKKGNHMKEVNLRGRMGYVVVYWVVLKLGHRWVLGLGNGG